MKLPTISGVLGACKRHPWRTGFASLAVVGVGLIVWNVSRPKQPEYVTAQPVRGDLVQTVEAVGTVISERDLNLQFPVSGIVDKVFVKEGDAVKAGQKLVQLRAGNLAAAVAAAAADAKRAEAQLQLLEEGTRPEDIIIAEAELQNKQASLDAAKKSLQSAEDTLKTAQSKLITLRRETDVTLSGDVSTAGATVGAQLVTLKTALNVIDDVFEDVDVQDVLLKSDVSSYTFLKQLQREAMDAVATVQKSDLSPAHYDDALSLLDQSRRAGQMANEALSRAYDIIATLPLTGSFTQAVRENHKDTLSTQKGYAQTAYTTLSDELSSLKAASANLDTRIAAEESTVATAQANKDSALADIRTYETAVRISQAQLELKRSGARPADIAAAKAQFQSARASLARAQAQFNDTILTAPIDGVITKVNLKPGESLSTSFESAAPVTMLGASPYRVEMYVAEIDVPKISLTHSGSIELDAFRGNPFSLRVGEIDPVATDRDGVPKYRVKLDFPEEPKDVRVGMTGDAEIFTGFSPDVVSVPLRAVLDRPDGTRYVRILKKDGTLEERDVTVGMEGKGGQVAVDSVKEDETIVVLIRE